MDEHPKVTRVELIVNAGRRAVIYNCKTVKSDLQDNGRTLKLFVEKADVVINTKELIEQQTMEKYFVGTVLKYVDEEDAKQKELDEREAEITAKENKQRKVIKRAT